MELPYSLDGSSTAILFRDQVFAFTQSKKFLGAEFLLWFWYTSDVIGYFDVLQVGEANQVTRLSLWVDDRLVLEAYSEGSSQLCSLRGGVPARTGEAFMALKQGKMVKELRVGIGVPGVGDFIAVLSAQDLAPRALQLPLAAQDEPQDLSQMPLERRLSLISLFNRILEQLFSGFLSQRVDAALTAAYRTQVQVWISRQWEGVSSSTPHTH